MADIYILGHGAWQTIGSNKPFVKVPRGTSIVFYTPVGRFINSAQTAAIMSGSANKLPPDREITEFKECPNLTLGYGLFPREVTALLQSGVRFVQVSQNTPLEEVLEKYAGNRLHWLACQPRLGGRDTTQGGFNDDY